MTDIMSQLIRAAHRRGTMTAPLSSVTFSDNDPGAAVPTSTQAQPPTMNGLIRARPRRHVDLFNTERTDGNQEDPGGASHDAPN